MSLLFHKIFSGIFGQVAWYTYSIEFQQRGPPHMHLVLSLVNHVRTTEQVDAICAAVLPVLPDKQDASYEATKNLRECVEKFMIHSPCENDMTVSFLITIIYK